MGIHFAIGKALQQIKYKYIFIYRNITQNMPLCCIPGQELCLFVGLTISGHGSCGLAVYTSVQTGTSGELRKILMPRSSPRIKSESMGEKTQG